jgi:hypothetical protein
MQAYIFVVTSAAHITRRHFAPLQLLHKKECDAHCTECAPLLLLVLLLWPSASLLGVWHAPC